MFAAKFVSPLYVAVIGCVPTLNADVLIAATPLFKLALAPRIAPLL